MAALHNGEGSVLLVANTRSTIANGDFGDRVGNHCIRPLSSHSYSMNLASSMINDVTNLIVRRTSDPGP